MTILSKKQIAISKAGLGFSLVRSTAIAVKAKFNTNIFSLHHRS